MVPARQKLLDAIRARPEDDDLRLVYADALEEAGDVEQAEFIRTGISIAQDRATPAEKARATELESLHGERFVGPVVAEHAEGWSFRRGLVDTIRSVPPCTLADHADEILGWAPIHTLVLGDAEDDPYDGGWEQWPDHTLAAARRLAACPHLAHLVTLDMSQGALGDQNDEGDRLRLLLESPHLKRLETILIGSECSTAAAIAIAEAHERLPALRVLRFGAPLGNGRVGDAGARAIAASPLCARLEVLEILASDVTREGFEPLAGSFRSLRELHLGGTWYVQNPIGAAGAIALAESTGVSNLETLDLGGAGVGDDGAIAIASAPWLASVRYLDLSDNDLTDRSALAIARSPFAKSLEHLALAYGAVHPVRTNAISDAAIATLFASIPSLDDVRVGADGGTRLPRPR